MNFFYRLRLFCVLGSRCIVRFHYYHCWCGHCRLAPDLQLYSVYVYRYYCCNIYSFSLAYSTSFATSLPRLIYPYCRRDTHDHGKAELRRSWCRRREGRVPDGGKGPWTDTIEYTLCGFIPIVQQVCSCSLLLYSASNVDMSVCMLCGLSTSTDIAVNYQLYWRLITYFCSPMYNDAPMILTLTGTNLLYFRLSCSDINPYKDYQTLDNLASAGRYVIVCLVD
jgi:hypothetical protein